MSPHVPLSSITKVTEQSAGPGAGVDSKECAITPRAGLKVCDQESTGGLYCHVPRGKPQEPLSSIAKVAEQGAGPSARVHSKERALEVRSAFLVCDQDRAGGLHRHATWAAWGTCQRPLGDIAKVAEQGA